jgi:uncharacterized phage protein (TIGR02218 family)
MKALGAGLQTHLDSGTTTLAWCWRVTRKDGTVYGFTEHDKPLTFLSTTFEPTSGLIASEIRASSDLAADAQEAEGVLSSSSISETDILDGKWDNADVEAWRVNWANTAQRVLLRRGSIGQLRRGRVSFVAEMRSITHILGQTVGRTYQSTCDAELGDARCGINLESAAYKGSGTVTSMLDGRSFKASGLSLYANGWFSAGSVEWVTGANAGRKVELASHTLIAGIATVTVLEMPVRGIAVSDTFLIRAGCDKVIGTCAAKFANVPNFRGFPNIPGNDAIMRYATDGGANSGGVL